MPVSPRNYFHEELNPYFIIQIGYMFYLFFSFKSNASNKDVYGFIHERNNTLDILFDKNITNLLLLYCKGAQIWHEFDRIRHLKALLNSPQIVPLCWWPTMFSYILIVDHNSIKGGFKVIDCIVLSAKYWGLNGSNVFIAKIVANLSI